jgi:hypothetical protein
LNFFFVVVPPRHVPWAASCPTKPAAFPIADADGYLFGTPVPERFREAGGL